MYMNMYIHVGICLSQSIIGNLDRVVQCRTKFEYKLWTAPDCAGTNYESSNRTWFYFSVDIPNNYPSKILRCVAVCIFACSSRRACNIHVTLLSYHPFVYRDRAGWPALLPYIR